MLEKLSVSKSPGPDVPTIQIPLVWLARISLVS